MRWHRNGAVHGRIRFGRTGQALPEAGVGIVVLTNTGGLENRGIPEPLAAALTRRLLGMPGNPVRDDVVPHPEVIRRRGKG